MEATDMRSLSRQARHERRVHVVRMRKAGGAYEEIAAQTGLSRTGVFDICKRHEADGARAALRDVPGRRKLGEGSRLDAAQEAVVRKLITDRHPTSLRCPTHCGRALRWPSLVADNYPGRLTTNMLAG